MQTYSTTPSRNVARAAAPAKAKPSLPVGIINRAMREQKPNPPGKK